MTPTVAVDTSVAVPLLLATHGAHAAVDAWAAGRTLVLCGHAAAETYSVLTRLPAPIRVTAAMAHRVMAESFSGTVTMHQSTAADAVTILAGASIAGGAVYDGVVALAARDNAITLATRDARALATYTALGITTLLVQ